MMDWLLVEVILSGVIAVCILAATGFVVVEYVTAKDEVSEYPDELKDRTMEERLKRHDRLVQELEDAIEKRAGQ